MYLYPFSAAPGKARLYARADAPHKSRLRLQKRPLLRAEALVPADRAGVGEVPDRAVFVKHAVDCAILPLRRQVRALEHQRPEEIAQRVTLHDRRHRAIRRLPLIAREFFI